MKRLSCMRWLVVLLTVLIAPICAQTKFEIADVHISPPTLDYHKRQVGGPWIAGDQVQMRRATMANLIALAWDMDETKVLGGPSWLEFDRFDVRAKMPAGATRQQLQPLFQALLAERFGLAVHKGEEQVPGWALTAGKNPQLQKSDGNTNADCKYDNQKTVIVITCHNITMPFLASHLPGLGDYVDDGLAVADRTGLDGGWDFTLKFAPTRSAAAANHTTTLFDGLEQIGLRLEPSTIPISGIVVDRVNRTPTPNSAGLDKAFPAPPAEFEAIVIKPSPPGDRTLNGYTAGDNTRVQYLPGGRVNIQGSLQGLVRWTFGINTVRIAGLPSWANDDSWDVTAKPPEAVNDSDAISEMLKALLVNRFHLAFHFEDRPFSSWTLVADKPKMKKADPSERTACREGAGTPTRSDVRSENPLLGRMLTCRNITMAQFATLLFKGMASGYVPGPAFDATGLEGGWDFTLNFSDPTVLASAGTGDAAAEPSGAISLQDAMRKQMGIRVEMQKQPVEMLVIDRLDRQPTEN